MTDVLRQGNKGIAKLLSVIVRVAIKELAEQSHTLQTGSRGQIVLKYDNYSFTKIIILSPNPIFGPNLHSIIYSLLRLFPTLHFDNFDSKCYLHSETALFTVDTSGIAE